jgi:serine/threonine protein kinase
VHALETPKHARPGRSAVGMTPAQVPSMSSTFQAQPLQSSEMELDAEEVDWIRNRVGRAVGCSHRVIRHLGSGGMGHVFLVEHVHLGSHAAIKVARRGSRSASVLLAREAALLARLNHPHVVSVIDWGRLGDGPEYMLMEYASGLELDAFGQSCGPLSQARSLGILRQVASTVDYIHAAGIVHADIKPANLLFDPRANDFVKVIDFGIAFRLGDAVEQRSRSGTPGYMAPEQLRGEPCGESIDIYGVAALAMELLTGRPPFEPTTPLDTLAQLCATPPLPSARGLCARGLDAVFARALHADPKQRYASAVSLVEALAQALCASPAPSRAAKRSALRFESDTVARAHGSAATIPARARRPYAALAFAAAP